MLLLNCPLKSQKRTWRCRDMISRRANYVMGNVRMKKDLLLKSTEINNVVVGKIRSIKVTGTSCREQCPLFVGFVETLSARYCNKKKKCSEETGDKRETK